MGDGPSADALLDLPVRNPKIAARVINGEAMIITPHDSVLHTLNPVATRIWELLPTHRTTKEIVDVLANEYGEQREIIEQDLNELIESLLELGILQRPETQRLQT